MNQIRGHLIEIQTPPQNSQDPDGDLARFQERYLMFYESGCVISVTDNPLGRLSYTAPETIDELGLPVDQQRLELHLNTFHRKSDEVFESGKQQTEQDLDVFIQHAMGIGCSQLLCVSGDGGARTSRLRPEDLGYGPAELQAVTSVELLRYIQTAYSSRFILGVAYNQYEPIDHELAKLRRKIATGACFLITQPVITETQTDARLATALDSIHEMMSLADTHGVQVILASWMSRKLSHLLPDCIGYDIAFEGLDPEENLATLREQYPDRRIYLTMVFGRKTLDRTLRLLR